MVRPFEQAGNGKFMNRVLLLSACLGALTLAASCSKSEGVGPTNQGQGQGDGDGSMPLPDPETPAEYVGEVRTGGYDDARSEDGTEGYRLYQETVQPLLAERCSSCHLGERFAFASFDREGAEFTPQETAANYRTFVDLLSLDAPLQSRLLAKIVPAADPRAILHRAGPQIEGEADPLYQAIVAWAQAEKTEHCPGCGIAASKAFVAYVKQPEALWMMERQPVRTDRGERTGSRIMLQPVDPATAAPIGPVIDFLQGAANGFCADNDCDFGQIAANHSGTALAFECRVSAAGEAGINRSWNICIAGVDADGKALEPAFLLPPDQLQAGRTISRTDPFGLPEGFAAKGIYDKHFITRNSRDLTPAFTPDDEHVVFAGQRPDPRTGVASVQTYHGEFFVDNLISVHLSGQNPTTIYRNEGGTADLPFYRRNGNIVFHTWNLDRMDQHMYVQALADGMMEMPTLGGRLQGPNMWGKAFESNNGRIVGMTGRRRGELSNYAPFVFDHTLGISTTNVGFKEFSGFLHIPEGYIDEIGDYPNGFCPSEARREQAAETKNCYLSKLMVDPSYLPDGRALIAYNPEKTYIGEGERFYLSYAQGDTFEQALESARQYLPKKLGIGVMDQAGATQVLLPNDEGFMFRHPVWVGPRQHPRRQSLPVPTQTTDIHIADLPLWFSFQKLGNTQGRKVEELGIFDKIVAVRVLRKIGDSNACLYDDRFLRMTNIQASGLHPSVLGMIDATGYERYVLPEAAGGNAHGDIPLKSDFSVKLRVPAGELLLIQGVNAEGEVIVQHDRVFALPGGHEVDTSVRRADYYHQCASCHGVVGGSESIDSAYNIESLTAEMSFDTMAQVEPAVDVGSGRLEELSYRSLLRPILDAKCISCHSGETPDGGLSLQETYSQTGNYPPSGWDASPSTSDAYLSFMEGREKIPSPNFSVTFSWFFDDDHNEYKQAFSSEIADNRPLADVAPWDPGYQNLFRPGDGVSWYYLSDALNQTAFGRGFEVPSNAAKSFLIEVLTGRNNDSKRDFDGAIDHKALLSAAEVRAFMAVLDVGFPYTGRCDDKQIPSGPNAGQPWGEATARPLAE